MAQPVLYLIACGAGPAADLPELTQLAMEYGWDIYVGTTPAGWEFIDPGKLSHLTGHPVRRDYSGRTSGWPQADAIIVAPATINTIDKFAAGIADCWLVNYWPTRDASTANLPTPRSTSPPSSPRQRPQPPTSSVSAPS